MDLRPHLVIMSLWFQLSDWERRRGRGQLKDCWKNAAHSLRLLHLHHLWTYLPHSNSSSLHLTFSFPLSVHPICPVLWILSWKPVLPPSSACHFFFPPSLSQPSFKLPWWYLIAVKQESGEQTAGEPTLILSCAICCSHMTELQSRSNTKMPHHTWHIDQSWPKSKPESENWGTVRMKRNHSNNKHHCNSCI